MMNLESSIAGQLAGQLPKGNASKSSMWLGRGAMTPKAIKAGYKRTGIWPVNRQAIPNYVREPSKLSECHNCLNVLICCLTINLEIPVALQCSLSSFSQN